VALEVNNIRIFIDCFASFLSLFPGGFERLFSSKTWPQRSILTRFPNRFARCFKASWASAKSSALSAMKFASSTKLPSPNAAG
jgi:hypothetical protein